MPRRGLNDFENKHVAYGLASDYSVRALWGSQYVDQSSSRGLEKFCEDILTIAPKLSGFRRCILSQILNFHD